MENMTQKKLPLKGVMVIKTNLKRNSLGTFIYQKLAEVREFTCEQCNKNIKSKTVVDYIDKNNNYKKICNGCYGQLLKEDKESVK